MDFSFSFMQGIMGNTIQQPPQLIDSANIRQEGTCDTGSDPGEDGGPSYDASLDAEFSYPPSASEDMQQVSNGFPPGLGMYEPQAKFSMYSQFPNGSANGYGAIRSYGEHSLMPGEGTVLRGPGLQERPLSPVSPPLPTHHPHLHHHHHHPHHHHHAHHFHSNAPHIQTHQHTQSPPPPPPLPSQHHLPQTPHIMTHTLPPPPPLHLPSSSPPPSLVDSTPSSQPTHAPSITPGGVLKKTSSPEIKLKIIKTYQNGKELFESALCGDLLQELQVMCISKLIKHSCPFTIVTTLTEIKAEVPAVKVHGYQISSNACSLSNSFIIRPWDKMHCCYYAHKHNTFSSPLA